MDLRNYLIEGFEYDLWANRIWLAVLPTISDTETREKFQHVLNHILGAQRNWLERCGGHNPELTYDLDADFEATAKAWQAFLRTANLEEEIHYSTKAGDRCVNYLRQIVLHVMNHGTYHRGHLRGLAQAYGIEDFEDTDLVRYIRLKSKATAG